MKDKTHYSVYQSDLIILFLEDFLFLATLSWLDITHL